MAQSLIATEGGDSSVQAPTSGTMAGAARRVAAESRRQQFADLLRSRRARLQPADVGLVSMGQRRTPGLRREEVAMLAGVSSTYYTFLEQGRDIQPSGQVIDALARALKMGAATAATMRALVMGADESAAPDA